MEERNPSQTTLRISLSSNAPALEPPPSASDRTHVPPRRPGAALLPDALVTSLLALGNEAESLAARVRNVVEAAADLIAHSPARDRALRQLHTLDPSSRAIEMELWARGEMHARWRFTVADLGVPLDPEGLLRVQQSLTGLLPLVRENAASLARQMVEHFPAYVTPNLLDRARLLLSKVPQLLGLIAESLPVSLRDAVAGALDAVDPGRKVVWLELASPFGYLPWIAWEHLLRSATHVPILRLSRQCVDAVAPKGALDVLLTCSTGDESAPIPARSVVALAREVLASLPPGRRCVVHVFADVQHRAAVLDALRASGLPFSQDDEPRGQRGVILYRFPGHAALPQAKRTWTSWIKSALKGRGIDVVHVMSAAMFAGTRPVLEVVEIPWVEPEQTTEYLIFKAPRVRLRHVPAAKIRSLANQLGAWAVVLSATQRGALRAQRALVNELSGLAPGAFAVHALADDPDARACGGLYRFLARSEAAGAGAPAVPDSPFISLQCHPARLEAGCSDAAIEGAFGGAFVSAANRVQAAMERHEATPTWLAAMQRQVEQSAAASLANRPVTERDKAVQNGVAAALTAAMQMMATHAEAGERESTS